MKIEGNKPLETQEAARSAGRIQAGSEPKPKAAAPEKAPASDRIDISRQGMEVAELMARIEKLPEVRDDKVQAIKEAIETGRYEVDPLKVAGKILSEL